MDGARNHYAPVETSKLRKPRSAALGTQYRGSRVSRDALTDDEDGDDPFGEEFEDEDFQSDKDEVLSQNEGSGSSEEDKRGVSNSDSSEDDRGAAQPRLGLTVTTREDRAGLLKAVTKELAQSTKADAEKGRAVRKQQSAFNSLLNTRIKLQKTLVGSNTIIRTPTATPETEGLKARDAIDAAETAAFNLWSSLNDFREELGAARAGIKRKRSTFTISTATEDLWTHMQTQEASSLPHRNVTLQRWYKKAKDATTLPERGLINKSANQATVIDALREHLSDRERLVKRAHTPRSCAPLQLANQVTEDDKIYDDADFYGLLLKELLEQKSQESVAASNIDLDFSARREARTKKNVDTKASKGRKLRYTVHEKLQNFMAPEDRRSWGERQTDDLFGSLFGQRMGLGEEREEDEEMVDGAEEEDAGLMLFRS